MKITPSTQLVDLDNKPIVADGAALTLAVVGVRALLAQQSEKPEPAEKQLERYDLARALNATKEGELEITTEQATLIKQAVAASFAPIVTGQVVHMIEGRWTP